MTPTGAPTRILFVCLGNICRSPVAENVFRHLVEEAGLEDRFEIDSAGTGSWHVGERPDRRSAAVAIARGIEMRGRARQVTQEDLRTFDYVLAMDRDNLRDLEDLARGGRATARIELLRSYDPVSDGTDVPDPYYGGPAGFENVFEIVSRSCRSLLASITAV